MSQVSRRDYLTDVLSRREQATFRRQIRRALRANYRDQERTFAAIMGSHREWAGMFHYAWVKLGSAAQLPLLGGIDVNTLEGQLALAAIIKQERERMKR